MTYAQKMIDERRLGYAEGREEGLEQGVAQGLEKGMAQGMEQGLKKAIVALKGVLDPAVIAERFQIPLEQVQGILEQG